MLTDYHVHLRPDDEGTTTERFFTAANAERYREAADERGIEELGVAEHIHRFVQSLEIWQHPWYRYWAKDDIDEYCDFVRDQGLKLGIEADYLPGREDRIANTLDGRPWDYVVGSVHFMGEDAVDVHGEPDWAAWDIWRGGDPERVWSRYFETLGEAARTGMFDILAHPDLVKVFGDRVPEARGRPAPLLRAGDGRHRRERRGDRSVHGGAAQAGGRDLPGAALPRDVPGRRVGRSRCRATRTRPSSSAGSTSARWSG